MLLSIGVSARLPARLPTPTHVQPPQHPVLPRRPFFLPGSPLPPPPITPHTHSPNTHVLTYTSAVSAPPPGHPGHADRLRLPADPLGHGPEAGQGGPGGRPNAPADVHGLRPDGARTPRPPDPLTRPSRPHGYGGGRCAAPAARSECLCFFRLLSPPFRFASQLVTLPRVRSPCPSARSWTVSARPSRPRWPRPSPSTRSSSTWRAAPRATPCPLPPVRGPPDPSPRTLTPCPPPVSAPCPSYPPGAGAGVPRFRQGEDRRPPALERDCLQEGMFIECLDTFALILTSSRGVRCAAVLFSFRLRTGHFRSPCESCLAPHRPLPAPLPTRYPGASPSRRADHPHDLRVRSAVRGHPALHPDGVQLPRPPGVRSPTPPDTPRTPTDSPLSARTIPPDTQLRPHRDVLRRHRRSLRRQFPQRRPARCLSPLFFLHFPLFFPSFPPPADLRRTHYGPSERTPSVPCPPGRCPPAASSSSTGRRGIISCGTPRTPRSACPGAPPPGYPRTHAARAACRLPCLSVPAACFCFPPVAGVLPGGRNAAAAKERAERRDERS